MGKKMEEKRIKRCTENADSRYDKISKSYKFTILDDKEVIRRIVENRASLARFGDGEFRWMMGITLENNFQVPSKELQIKLKETLNSNLDNLIIGVPKPLVSVDNYNDDAVTFWKKFVSIYGKKLRKIIPTKKEYANTNLTRFYMDYKVKDDCAEKVQDLRKIWNDRDVIIIEGNKTKLGIGNDLLNNARSIRRIIGPNKDAFVKYKEILAEAEKYSKDTLFIMALGPTATVLAYELAKDGFQAIDIGHVDVEYEWFLSGTTTKEPIKGKFVNEAKNIGDLSDENIEDEAYNNSIIKTIL